MRAAMGSLLLVRHGQASFLSEDYDRLSPLGEEQARRLGQAWVRRGVRLDGAFVGPRLRQRRTAELVLEVLGEAGLPAPTLRELPALDEMQAQLLLQKGVPELLLGEPRLRALAEGMQEAVTTGRLPQAEFQRLFEAVMAEWVAGRLVAPGLESWAEFRGRVVAALDAMMASVAGSSGARVAGFTSGGPVAISMQRAGEMSDAATLALTGTVRNASVTEFLFRGSRFSLSLYNEVSHLHDEPRLLTYR